MRSNAWESGGLLLGLVNHFVVSIYINITQHPDDGNVLGCKKAGVDFAFLIIAHHVQTAMARESEKR